MGLLCAEQDVGNLNKCIFNNYGTPGRRTKRRKSQKMHFQEFWDSCAQNKTSETSTRGSPSSATIVILGDLQEYLVTWRLGKPFLGNHRNTWGSIGIPGNLEAGEPFCNSFLSRQEPHYAKACLGNALHFDEFWDSCAQNKTSEISKRALSRTL